MVSEKAVDDLWGGAMAPAGTAMACDRNGLAESNSDQENVRVRTGCNFVIVVVTFWELLTYFYCWISLKLRKKAEPIDPTLW